MQFFGCVEQVLAPPRSPLLEGPAHQGRALLAPESWQSQPSPFSRVWERVVPVFSPAGVSPPFSNPHPLLFFSLGIVRVTSFPLFLGGVQTCHLPPVFGFPHRLFPPNCASLAIFSPSPPPPQFRVGGLPPFSVLIVHLTGPFPPFRTLEPSSGMCFCSVGPIPGSPGYVSVPGS